MQNQAPDIILPTFSVVAAIAIVCYHARKRGHDTRKASHKINRNLQKKAKQYTEWMFLIETSFM